MKKIYPIMPMILLISLYTVSLPVKGIPTKPIVINDSIPTFLEGYEYERSDGTMFSFDQVKGKVLLIDFWATWCGPCIKEHPYVAALENDIDSQNFQVITVSVDKNISKWQDFLISNKWTGIHIKVDNKDVNNPLNQMVVKQILINGDTLHRTSVPQYYLVDKDMSIEEIKNIQTGNTLSLIRKKIESKE